MRAIDSNVLVRLVARDDPGQVASAESFVERGAWLPQLVLAETVWVLRSSYGFGHQQIATTVAMLLENEKLIVEGEEAVRRALDAFKRHARVGFADCLIVEAARKAGHVPLGTFDKAMSRLDGTVPLE